jgi:serine/threonine protein kinase
MSGSDNEDEEYSNYENSNEESNSNSSSVSTYDSNEESDGDNSGANNAEFVAKGGFGCVVKPALRNIDSGALKSFPGQISKVFKSETSYEDAIEASQKAYNIMGKNKGHKVTGYKRAFTGSNLKKATRKGCRILGRKTIYPVRMDDLGKDISKIESYYKTLRAVPFVTILEEIVKVFHQVKLVYDAGYIHGDIRETNIMVNPHTGRLTLIDFDWFLRKAKFLNDYKESFGFYSNPPEALLYWYIRQPLITKTALEQKFNDYVKYTNGVRTTPITAKQLEEANLANYHHFFTPAVKALSPVRQWEALQKLLFKTFDSYGLAFTIQRLVRYVYPGTLDGRITNNGVPYSAAELAIIEDIVLNVNGLLDRMTQLNVAGRIVIKDAYSMIKELLEEYKTKVLVATAPKTPPTRGKPTTPLSPKAPPPSPVSNRKTRRRARH